MSQASKAPFVSLGTVKFSFVPHRTLNTCE